MSFEAGWNKGWNHTLRNFRDEQGRDFEAYVTEFLDFLAKDPTTPLNGYQAGVCDAIDLLVWGCDDLRGGKVIDNAMANNLQVRG